MYDLTQNLNSEILEKIEEKDWKFFENYDSGKLCSICLIKKPIKTWHCAEVNLCIPKFHFYSKFFDRPVFFANERNYLALLIMEVICLVLYILGFYACYENELHKAELVIFMKPVFISYLLIQKAKYFTFLLSWGASWLLLVKIYHLVVFLYAVSKNLTLDEMYNTPRYRYLFEKSARIEGKFVYKNRADEGFLPNWCLFIKQGFYNKPLNHRGFN